MSKKTIDLTNQDIESDTLTIDSLIEQLKYLRKTYGNIGVHVMPPGHFQTSVKYVVKSGEYVVIY